MSEEKRKRTSVSDMVRPASKQKQVAPPAPTHLDFENNLAEFDAELFEFIAQTDPNFDLNLLQNNPNPPVAEPPTPPSSDAMYPATKEELGMPLRLTGPKVVESDIFGDEVILESEVRVKGSVYGRKEVHIGPSCVIEGAVISEGAVQIAKGCRIEGAVVASDISLNGPVRVEGPVFSRGRVAVQGQLEAQALYASGAVSCTGNPKKDEVRIAAGLIVSRKGRIETDIPVYLANVKTDPEKQKFFLARTANQELDLKLTPPAGDAQPAVVLTSLTDADLEKLVTELASFEERNQ
jgi:cytoskeletal protein CcmA (bactofilin family)